MVTGICIQLVDSLPCASVRMAGGTLKITENRTVKDDTHPKKKKTFQRLDVEKENKRRVNTPLILYLTEQSMAKVSTALEEFVLLGWETRD